MAVQLAVIVLVDIGGYTRFMNRLRQSLAHAEATITDLLDAIIESAEQPLIVNELEGDAVFFYATATEETLPAVAAHALQQANHFIGVFERRKAEMIRDVICECDACEAIVDLTIKAVLHHGEVQQRRFHRFNKISGVPVIEAHRLLKNSVPVKEYLLCSASFDAVSGGVKGQTGKALVEHCEGIGDFNVVYYVPDSACVMKPAAVDRWRQLKFMARMSSFLIQRQLGLKKRRFHNLAA